MVRLSGKPLLSAVTALTCLSFLLIGFDNGVLGGLISQPAFNDTFDTPDPTITGLIVALYDVGCFLGAVVTAIWGEKLGRIRSLMAGSVIMTIGALLQATAYVRAHIIVARIVSGIGMGLINSTAPVYQSEFSPRSSRGIFACAQLSTLNFGIFLAYWIDYAFAGIIQSYAWRVPVILQCIFILPIFFLCFVLPESPRWLIVHNRAEEARDIFHRLWDASRSNDEIEEVYNGVVAAVNLELKVQKRGWISLFQEDEIGSRRRLLIACSIQFFQQLGGINGVIYYAGTIFSKSLGFDSYLSSLMSGFLFTWFFVASFIPWALIERIGRRPLLLSMISLMAAVFAVLAALVKQIQEQTSITHAAGAGAAAMLFVYLGAFTIGFQATVWVYPPEILPLSIRQRGTAMATACNWIINFTIVQIAPVGISNIGWKFYIIFAIFNASFVPVIFFFYPETKGLELEHVDLLFAKGESKRALEVVNAEKYSPVEYLEHQEEKERSGEI